MSFFKSNKKEEENTQLRQEILELTQMIQKNESVIEKIQNDLIQSQRTSQESIVRQNEDTITQRTRFDKLEDNIAILEEKINEYMQVPINQQNEMSSDNQSSLEERITKEINVLSQSQENTQTRISTLSQALDMLGNGVEELNQVMKQQIGTRPVERESEERGKDLSKQTKDEIISTIKDEQKGLFDKFSDIVNQFNIQFHEELTDTVHTLQDSHNRILAELGDHYMPKSIGYELQQLLNDFSNEFKFETQNLRVQIANIKFYQRELLQFRQEIQTMIDNKVNEKFNAISILLSTVSTKTEEISLYLKNSEIQVSPSTEQSYNVEDHQKY